MNDFVKLNREKKNFYSATINGYLDYLDQLKIVNAGESKESPSERYKIKLLKKPVRKVLFKRQFSSIHAILMKCLQPSIEAVGNVVMTAVMKHSSLKMIIKTLLRSSLIPMQHQCDFEYTIDFADNIIPLCPTCHRRIHLPSSRTETGCLRNFTLNVLMILRFMELIFRLMSWNRIMYRKSRLRCGLLFIFEVSCNL